MITPFSYLLFLLSLLIIYLGFLILPRGFKAQCLGSRRRYRKKRQRNRSSALPSPQVQDEEAPSYTQPIQDRNNNRRETNCNDTIWEGIEKKQVSSGIHTTPPKNIHVHSMLDERVWKKMTQSPGLRLIAHGIKVRPRPVWIQLHVGHNNNKEVESDCLSWRAEMKTAATEGTLSNNTSSLGSIRKVALTDIVGIELGQKTVALKRLGKEKLVKESECFSILTNTGTLDLQCVASNDMGVTSAEDMREACLSNLSRVLTSSNGGVGAMLSPAVSRTSTNAISTVSF